MNLNNTKMTKEQTDQILTALNLRLGYADPSSCKYLFIGGEEGGDPINLNSVPLNPPPLSTWTGKTSKAKKDWSPIYTIMSKIVVQLENVSDLDDYQINKMCHIGDFTGLMNLFPLPKKTTDASDPWPYQDITREQYQEWLFYNHQARYAEIRHAQSGLSNLKATICFGCQNWQDFINCFNLSFEQYTTTIADNIRVYGARKIILTPFFQSRYGTITDKEYIPEIVAAIKSL